MNLKEQVTFGLDSGKVPKLWLVFSNLISASPAPEAKANNPNINIEPVVISRDDDRFLIVEMGF